MTISLKSEILEHLSKDGKKPITAKIASDRSDSRSFDRAQPRGKTKINQDRPMLKVGNTALYEHKEVKIQGINESGMALVKFMNRRDPIIVRASDLQVKTDLTEGFIGMAPIEPTFRTPSNYGFMKVDLSPEDIGLINLREDDEEDGEEDDNGSNVRHDGHTGKTEVDAIPTPSDTIATAYTDEKGPKEDSTPLSIEPGAQENLLWQAPEWDGYDYPADSPDIPTAEFDGEDGGNARAPHFNSGEHQPGDGQEDRSEDDGDEEINEMDVRPVHSWLNDTHSEYRPEKPSPTKPQNRKETEKNVIKNPSWPAHKKVGEGKVTDPARKDSHKNLAKMRKDIDFSEQFSFAKFKNFLKEMGDMEPDQEPSAGDKITLSLPAMAAVLVTVCNRQPEENTLKAMVEALAELSKGKTIEMSDLDSVADHMNGSTGECAEIDNREAGRPDHEGMESDDSSDGFGDDDSESDSESDTDDDSGGKESESWPGDGEKTKSGKTKLFGGGDAPVEENYFNGYDVMEGTAMSEAEVIRMVKRRAGLKYWE